MSRVFDEIRAEAAEKARLELAIDLYTNGEISKETVIRIAKLPEGNFNQKLQEIVHNKG